MSEPLMRMYISFFGMILLFVATGLILLARHKLSGVISGIVAVIAYLCMIVGGFIIIYIVFSGPTPE
ncbi:Ni,Fe-hydrogenase I cytochrome b subunit [Alkalibacillus flavidus]|uniref:Ni,Fe-hydrogenase I cytochrome b subunit n=1 Tax=Alkalibacillus flavidus TaxID=546021 RepID=A0ABV2KRY9_9BACI